MTGAHRGSATEVLLYISVVWLVARNIFVRIIKTIKPKSAMKSFPLRYIVIPGSCFLGVSSDNDWRRQWQPTPVLLPGNSHGRRSLVGCSPWSREESDTTERLDFHFSLSCIGEGNGNQLQYSCLENPRDRGAWWAAVSRVAQSQTWLKRLSSSSNNDNG